MSGWAANPLNHRESLAKAALPRLLMRDCYLSCVEDTSAKSELT